MASGVGLALAWHGAGFTGLGRGQARVGRVARADRRGRDPHPDRLDRDGPGDQDDLPAARRRRPRRARSRPSSIAPQDTAFVPDSGPTVASRTAMVVGGLLIQAARPAARPRSRRRPAGTFAATYRDYARTNGAAPDRPALRAVPGRRLRRRDLPRRRLPGVRLGGLRRERRRRPRHRRGPRPRRRRRRRHRPGHPPGPRRGPGRGRHAPGGRLRDDRGDQAARRALPQRPAGDLHHPDLARRAADHDDPRRGAVRRRPARREGRRRAADGRRGAGRGRGDRRCDRGLDRGPAGQPGADPRGARRRVAGRGAAAARRLGAGRRRWPGDDRLSGSRSTPRRSRSTCPGCAACSTSCARTSR